MSMFTTRLAPALLALVVVAGTPACATGGIYPQRYPVGDRDDRAYYTRGFAQGRDAGMDDARRGRPYDPRRHGAYRDNRRGDDRGDVRAFRQGFEDGYDDGFRRFARGSGSYDPRRSYPPQGSYGPGRDGRYASAAHDHGYRDGLEAGQRAARRGDRFDPIREKRYRDGDHDYNSRYGSRDEYKRAYRSAFQQGYEDGFRGYRR